MGHDVAMVSIAGSGFDWSQFGPFAAAIFIAWFLLNRSDRQIDKEREDSVMDAARLWDELERERDAHDATRRAFFDYMSKNPPSTPDRSEDPE